MRATRTPHRRGRAPSLERRRRHYIARMTSDRARDIALTEAAFRIANERMARWDERHSEGAPERYLCECASQPCRERISLTREQYEAVRSDVKRFVVVPG